jgi:hypothetical protein
MERFFCVNNEFFVNNEMFTRELVEHGGGERRQSDILTPMHSQTTNAKITCFRRNS